MEITEARVNGSKRRVVRCNIAGLRIALATLVALVVSALVKPDETALAAGTASDGPGVAASWTTGNKLAVGSSAEKTSKVWFTVAKGITSEVFYPRLDIPNMQDMQYIITDGLTFVDLERDATNQEISMPDEKALEYTVTNTDKRATPKYRITNTYITDRSHVGSRADVEAMNRAIEMHRLHPVIDQTFLFAEAKEAYRHFERRGRFGKVVITHG
jgi:hypothetical protein